MTRETEQLDLEIQSVKEKQETSVTTASDGVKGYTVAITIFTDLFGCIFIGCAIGLFLQKVFQTSVLLTAGLTFLGGVAGLYTVVRYALSQERKQK